MQVPETGAGSKYFGIIEWPRRCVPGAPPPPFLHKDIILSHLFCMHMQGYHSRPLTFAPPQEYHFTALSSAPLLPCCTRDGENRTLESEECGTRRRGTGLDDSLSTSPSLRWERRSKDPKRKTDAWAPTKTLLARQSPPRMRISILPRRSMRSRREHARNSVGLV